MSKLDLIGKVCSTNALLNIAAVPQGLITFIAIGRQNQKELFLRSTFLLYILFSVFSSSSAIRILTSVC
jgi:hypothetical protein